MNPQLAEKIKTIVGSYERAYPEEFSAYQAQMKIYRDTLANKHASLIGTHVQERELLRLPEKLDLVLQKILTPEEHELIWDAKDPTAKGVVWFAKTFPQYRVPEKL